MHKKLTHCMLGNFFMLSLSTSDLYFQNKSFQKYFSNPFRVSNGLDPDQDRRYVDPDLVPNRLQRLANDKVRR